MKKMEKMEVEMKARHFKLRSQKAQPIFFLNTSRCQKTFNHLSI